MKKPPSLSVAALAAVLTRSALSWGETGFGPGQSMAPAETIKEAGAGAAWIEAPRAEPAKPVPAARVTLPIDQWRKPGGSWEVLDLKFTSGGSLRKKHQSSFAGSKIYRDADGHDWTILRVKQYFGYRDQVYDTMGCFFEGGGHCYRMENYLGINGHWVHWSDDRAEPSLGGLCLRADGGELVAGPLRVWAKDAAALGKDGLWLRSLSWVQVVRGHNSGYDRLVLRIEPAGAGLADAEAALKAIRLADGPHWFNDDDARALAFAWAASRPLKAETVYLRFYFHDSVPRIEIGLDPDQTYARASLFELRRPRQIPFVQSLEASAASLSSDAASSPS